MWSQPFTRAIYRMKNSILSGSLFSLFFIVLLACSAKADLYSPLFGVSATYNNVFFGDFYGRNGDIEGHAAIKGDVDVIQYGFGSGEQNLHPNSQGPTLVVGGNVTARSSGVYDGDAYIAGAIIPHVQANGNAPSIWNSLHTAGTGPYNSVDPGYKGTPGTIYVAGMAGSPIDWQYQAHTTAPLPFDFDTAERQLRAVSSHLFGLEDTVHTVAEPLSNGTTDYRIDLTGLSGIQVVTIDASIFNSLPSNRSIFIDAGADTTLIINISDIYGMGSLDLSRAFVINGVYEPSYGDFDGSNILINTDVSQVNIYKAAINASLMALDAIIYVEHGNIDGQAFGAGAHTTNGGEFHAYYVFNDQHFGGGAAAVPEPATCVLLATGLIGLGYVRSRRQSPVH